MASQAIMVFEVFRFPLGALMKFKNSNYFPFSAYFYAVVFAVFFASSPGFSQDMETGASVDILPAMSLNDEDSEFPDINIDLDMDYPTHPPMRLTPDKSELLKLDTDVSTIIVGNPNHLNILADNARTLVLVGRAAGATHFIALDNKGDIIMQRHVIVASPKEKYVRIRRSCVGGDEGCLPTQVYYCPDMCHEIIAAGGEDSGSGTDAAAAAEATEDLVDQAAGEDIADEGM